MSCKLLQYILSEDLIAHWSLSCCFLYLIFFLIILYKTTLPNDRAHPFLAEYGKQSILYEQSIQL